MNKIKLSKLANINMGQSPKSENYCNNEGVPFLQGNRTFGEKYPEIDTYTKQITKLAKKGEILISVRAPVGDLNIAPVDLCIGRGLSAINSFDSNNEFLYYCLKYNVRNILKQSSGTTYDSINRDILENFELITPKKEDYIKVGEILSKIDNKIELNNKINSELEAMAKTIYDYWFLQFEFPNEEGKPYKSSGGKMVWNEELKREIPEGWEIKKLGNYISLIRGVTYSKEDISFQEKKDFFPLLKSNNIQNGKIIYKDIIYVKKSLISENQILDKNSVFITMSSGSKEHMGKTAIIYDDLKYTFGAFCSKIKIQRDLFSFLSIFLTSKIFKNMLNNLTLGTSINNINNEYINNIKIVVPNPRILKQFDDKIKKIFEKQGKIIFENQELTSLRDFLLPLLMNGQVGFKEE